MGVKLVHISKIGTSGDLYVLREFQGQTDPGYGGGVPANPHFPDNTLPSGPPPMVTEPGATLVLVRDPLGVWHYATIAPGSPPPRPLPTPPPDHIANRPPGSGLPPHMSGQPVPPTAQPTGQPKAT